MPTKIRISILLLMVTVTCFSQSVNKLSPAPVIVRKGLITLPDGTMFYYKHLQYKNDSVFFQDLNLNAQEMGLQDISQITKVGSYAGIGALTGGGLGLLFGIAMAKALDNTGDFLVNIFSLGEDKNLDTRKEQTSTIILYTLIGAGLGTGLGALFPKNKIIFSNSNSVQSITFMPGITMNPYLKPEVGVTCRINFR